MLNRLIGVRLSLTQRILHLPIQFASETRGATKVLATALICSATILAAEIVHTDHEARAPDEIVAPLPRFPSSESGASSVAENLEKIASTLQARPLFAPDRRPPAHVVDLPATAAAEPQAKLVGTIISNKQRIAFLELAGKQMARVVGDRVGSKRIIAISQAWVRLQSNDGQLSDMGLTWGTQILPPPPPPQLEPSHVAFHLEK